MKKFGFILLACALFALVPASGLMRVRQTAEPSGRYVAGELLVKFKNTVATRMAAADHARIGAEVVEEFAPINWQHIKLPAGMSVGEGIEQYRKLAVVEAVQPNYIYQTTNTPNDTSYGQLYGMTKIGAPTAWDTTTGSSNIVVAVIDTGVYYNHQDLSANMWHNPGEIAGNGIDDDGNGYVDDVYGVDTINYDSDPLDDFGHGTHVAGTIGAVGNNSLGVVGVNWNVRLMAVKTHDSSGNGTAASVIAAFQYVTMMKTRGVNIRVTNSSWGGAPEAASYDQALKDAIDACGNAGILNSFAAGNDNQNDDAFPFYPASYTSPSIIAVAASTSTDAKASFSSWGLTSVDLAAPGSSILSTYNSSPTSYATLSGTSMASPHVAGAAALLSASNPSLSAASLKASLMNTVDALSAWSTLVASGGRLNVARAIQTPTVCAFNLSAVGQSFPSSGGSGSVTVTAANNCGRMAVSNAPSWITVTSGDVGSGNGAIGFTVAPNTNAAQRTGAIRIADQTFTITQAGTGVVSSFTKPLDFDGDGKTDYAVIRPASMSWYTMQSTNGFRQDQFGLSTDQAVPADYDGDGKWDIAVWRSDSQAYFYILQSQSNTLRSVQWGATGDQPLRTQDFDGDGKADPTVVRNTSGVKSWFILQSANGNLRSVQFGSATSDTPIRGDFDGDGKADPAVYRTSSGAPANTFFVLRSSDGAVQAATFGLSSSDLIVPADFDGDGKTDYAVFRNNGADAGNWYWLQSSDGAFRAAQFGQANDSPVPGDYDGDGKTDLAVWRGATPAIFYVNRSTGGIVSFQWGDPTTDYAVADTLQCR
ncbi:MAG TPA: S8 family serine peptidase [Pyrinomonadaceae bacterium]|jgi:subtilisin family serine protease